MNDKIFNQAQSLITKLTELEIEYYGNRSRLAFLYSEINEEERNKLELSMPLLDEKIKKVRKEIEELFSEHV